MVITATLLMLIIIVPVIALTLFFAGNTARATRSRVRPNGTTHHAGTGDLDCALMIIIALGAPPGSAPTSSTLPPLDCIDAQRPLPA